MLKEKSMSRTMNRMGVIVNYLCLIFIVMIFVMEGEHQWHYYVIPIGIISLSLFIWSFIKTYWISGVWKFTHMPITRLDEDETYILFMINRRSYMVFTIFVVLLILAYSVLTVPIHITVMAALLYLAHILPASIYQWSNE